MNKKINNNRVTDIANSDDLKIKGYFRLQKSGKNRTEKKLVWVNKKRLDNA